MLNTMHWSGPVGTLASTPFLTYKVSNIIEIPEVVYIDGDGDGVTEPYYHVIVGSMADGFIQESYIQAGYSMMDAGSFININAPPGTSLPAGGYGSASAGNYYVTLSGPVITNAANGSDPLGVASSSGNGTANPRRVITHQINSDGEFFSYFKKDSLANKPYIYQTIDSFGTINVTFEMDMSNSTYDDASTAGIIKQNSMQLFGDKLPSPTPAGIPDATYWNMSTDSQNTSVTGGKFTYTDGSDVLGSPGGSEGTYNYGNGSFDQTTIDWTLFFDPTDPSGNPWAVESAKPP